MKKMMILALTLSTSTAQAQSLTIHHHPQLATYTDPSQWPTHSSQCHWMLPNGTMAHLHVDPTSPDGAETSGKLTIPLLVGLFNTSGKITNVTAQVGNFNGGKYLSVPVMPSNMIGSPNQFITYTGTVELDPLAEHGWYWLEVSVDATFEDGTGITTNAMRPLFSTVDSSSTDEGYGGWTLTECKFRNTPNNTSYGAQTVQFDYVTADKIYIPLPLLPISNGWPMYLSTYGYGQIPQDAALTRFVLDPNYHQGDPGTTLSSVTQVPDVSHMPIVFNQPGTHKYAVIRDLNVPEINEHVMALLVATITGTADINPVPQPIPPIPPPTPPTFVILNDTFVGIQKSDGSKWICLSENPLMCVGPTVPVQ